MPQVGNRHFPYNRAGFQAARMARNPRMEQMDALKRSLPAKASPVAREAVAKPKPEMSNMPVGKPVKMKEPMVKAEVKPFPRPRVMDVGRRTVKF